MTYNLKTLNHIMRAIIAFDDEEEKDGNNS